MLTSLASSPILSPRAAPPGAASIDASLARGIRRTYFRELEGQWKRLKKARTQAMGRNASIARRINSDKQLRERLHQLEKMVGSLIPCASAYVDANSRGAAFILGLRPNVIPTLPIAECQANLVALTLLRPGYFLEVGVRVKVSGHAVDRVVQRAKLVELPLRKPDIEAINAEFADALPLACIATEILLEVERTQGGDSARDTQVLLPAPHGVFLASWSCEEQALIIRTFIDGAKLTDPQREAVREISQWADGQLSTQVLNILTAGWMNVGVTGLKERLLQTWRDYGWRFDEQRLHPGLSDRAWATPH
jgi:hypothetical protein